MSVGMTNWKNLSAFGRALRAATDAHLKLADAAHRGDAEAERAAREELLDALTALFAAWTDLNSDRTPVPN